MITTPRPTRQVVPRPTYEVVRRHCTCCRRRAGWAARWPRSDTCCGTCPLSTPRFTPRSTRTPGCLGQALADRPERWCVVTGPLRHALADYLALRRALGYRLERPEKLLSQFLAHLESTGQDVVSVGNAVDERRHSVSAALAAADAAVVVQNSAARYRPELLDPLPGAQHQVQSAGSRSSAWP